MNNGTFTLYEVTCHRDTDVSTFSAMKLYVIAKSPNEAEALALATMTERKWGYDKCVSQINVVAND